MAGGMRRRNALGTLAERSGADAPPAGAAPPSGGAATASSVPPVRHCWVTTPEGEVPGLLLCWERRPGGWYGRVVHPARAAGQGWAVVEDWVPGAALRPVAGERG